MAVRHGHQGLAGATETNAQSFFLQKGNPQRQVPQAWAYLKAGGTLFSLEESGLVSTRWDCSPGSHTGRSEHPAPPRCGLSGSTRLSPCLYFFLYVLLSLQIFPLPHSGHSLNEFT